jgi:hypothetical protein
MTASNTPGLVRLLRGEILDGAPVPREAGSGGGAYTPPLAFGRIVTAPCGDSEASFSGGPPRSVFGVWGGLEVGDGLKGHGLCALSAQSRTGALDRRRTRSQRGRGGLGVGLIRPALAC